MHDNLVPNPKVIRTLLNLNHICLNMILRLFLNRLKQSTYRSNKTVSFRSYKDMIKSNLQVCTVNGLL